jgi:hypothetical protein
VTFVLQPERKCLPLTRPWLLPTVWITGFAAGIFVSKRAAPLFLSLMRGLSFDSVSIVGLIVSAGVPFLISAFAVIYSRPLLFYSVCFLKSFYFVFSSVTIINHYGSGGWLVQRFLMANEILNLPILYTFWLRCFRLRKLPGATEWLGFISLEMLVLTFVYRLPASLLTELGIL